MRQLTISDGRASLRVSELCLGTMYFGYRTDEATAFAILDRFLEAGGTFLDTANNYGQWHGEAGERAGHRTLDAVPRRLRNLGVDRLDLYYAHVDDRSAPLAETVDALASLAESGKAGLLGASNTATWRIERARSLARAAGRPGYSCVQQQHTYLLAQPEPGQLNLIAEELLDYARSEQLTLLAYSPLLAGAYAYPDRSVPAAYQHAANRARLATLRDVANEHGATANQVVLAWLLHRQPAIIPVPGASSVAQLDEILAATELKLNAEDLDRLDTAGRFAN
jgi:aryl-alcohol dehydrogenase-like predicted oxidoreductase